MALDTKDPQSNDKDWRIEMHKSLGPCLSNAIYQHSSGLYDIETKWDSARLKRCIEQSQNNRAYIKDALAKVDQSVAKEICRFHSETIQPLVQRYLDSTNNHLDKSNHGDIPEPPTTSCREASRIGKAFYRLQFAHNLHSKYQYRWLHDGSVVEKCHHERESVLRQFLHALEPHDRKDLKDIHDWAKKQYEGLILEARKTEIPYVPIRTRYVVEEFITHGLDDLQRCCREGFDPKQVKETLVHWPTAPFLSFLDHAFESTRFR